MKQTLSFLILPVMVVALVLGAGSSALAQTTTWNGSGSDWNTSANWNNGVPASGGTASFDRTGAGNLTVGISSPVTVENIQFDGDPSQSVGGNYVIGSTTGNVITLTSGGNIGFYSWVITPATETINAPLIIAGTSGSSYNFEHQGPYNANTSTLVFNGTVTGAATATNTTTLNIGNDNNTFNGVIGDGTGGGQVAINLNGGGTQTFAANNTYTGSTTLNYNSNSTLDVTGSLGNTAIFIDGGPSIYYGPGSVLNLMAAGAVSQNLITTNGGTLNETVDGAISGTASIYTSGGLANLSTANTYTGATHVSGSYYDNSGNNPRTPNMIITGSLGNTAVTVDEADAFPGWLELNGAGAISQNTLTINGGQVTQGVAGAITGTTTVKINESNSGAYGTIGTAFFGDGNTYTGTTTLDGSNSNVTLNITSLADGGSPSSIGSSSNAASNLIFAGGILQATTLTTAQSTDRLFTLGDTSSNGNNGNSASAIIDSSSSNPAGTLSFTNTGAIVDGLVSGQYTPSTGIILTGSNTGANLFAPLISDLYNPVGYVGATYLTKSGNGNWIISNADTFTGNTNLNGGTLQLNNTQALQYSQVQFNSANSLTFGSSGTASSPVAYSLYAIGGSSNENLSSGDSLQLGTQIAQLYNPYNTFTYNGSFSGAGGIIQQGLESNQNNETQVFTANNSYTGTTTVNSSILKTTLSSNGTPFGTGSLALNGGTLSLAPSGGSSSTNIAYTGASASGASVTYSGNGALFLNKGSNNSLTLTVGDGSDPAFTRIGKGTLIIESNSADLGSGTGSSSGGENLVAATAPATLHGIVTPTIVGINGLSFPYGGTYTTSSLDFLTYGGSYTGFGVASYTNHASNFAPTTGEIANITGSVTTYASGNPYALRVAQNQTLVIGSNTILTVGDGTDPAAIILNSTGSYGPQNMIFNNYGGSNGVLNFGTSEGLVYVTNWAGISPVITGSGGLTISGIGQNYSGVQGGALTLQNNNNTFTGGITVNSGAVLAYPGGSNGNQFANGTFGDPNNVITLNGGAISNGWDYGSTDIGIARSIVLTNLGGTLGDRGNFVSDISGTGALTIGAYNQYGNNPGQYGNRFVVLSGNNTFSGGLVLYSNYLTVSSNANLGAATSPITFDGGYIAIMGNNMHDFGSHVLTFVPTNTVALDIQDPNNVFTLSQPLTQYTGGLAKMGAGTLVLTGASTYIGSTNIYGGTSVFGGTLKVDASQGGSLSSNSRLFLDGGTFYLLGNTTGSTVQNFTGLTMGINENTSDATTGGGTIVADSNTGSGSQSTTINLGTISLAGDNNNNGNYGSGSQTANTLDLVVTGNGTSTITTTTKNDTTGNSDGGIYGGRIVYTDSTGTNWATTVSPGPTYTLTGLGEHGTSYNTFSNIAGETASTAVNDNLLLSGSDNTSLTSYWVHIGQPPAPYNLTFNSLKITSTGAGESLDIQGFNVILNSGGLLYTGSDNYSIIDTYSTPGSLQSGLVGTNQNGPSGGDDLIIQQYGTGSLTISAIIADGPNGASTLTKAGPGTLILSAANTYTGQTFVNGGTLSIGAADNISTYRLNLNGGTLQATGTFTSPNIYLGSSGGTINVTGNNVLTVPRVENFVGGGNDGPAGLTINGDGSTGTVFLSYTGDLGGNIFYGGVTIGGGILQITGYQGTGTSDSAALGATPANYLSWTPTSTGRFQLNGNQESLVTGLESLSTDAVVENGGATQNIYSHQYPNSRLVLANGDNETFAGTLVDNFTGPGNGTLSFLKAGSGSISFTNTNSSYTGTTELDGGIVNVASLANGGADSSIGASTNVANNLIFGGGTLQYTGSAAQTTDHLFTLGDSGIGGNNGTIDASGTGTGTVSFTNTGAVAFGNTGVHSLTLTGSNTGMNSLAAAIGDSTYNSTVYPTSLTKTGAGTWEVSGASTFTGGTTVQAGTLAFSNVGSAPTVQALGTGPVTLDDTTTLQYVGGTSTLGVPITVATGGSATIANSASGVLTLADAISKNGSTLNISGGKFVIAGGITGSSAHSDVNYVGGSTTGITNVAGTYYGPTSISGGSTVLAGVNNALADTMGGASANTDLTVGAVSDGAVTNTFDLLGNNQTVASLTDLGSGTNQVISGNGVAGTATTSTGPSTNTGKLTINYTNTSTADTFGGSLGGSGTAVNFSVTKSGAGNLILSGANTYTGGTTVSAGTLTASNTSGSATGTGPVTVASTGKLAGDGAIGGGLAVLSGGTLSPGLPTAYLGLTLASSTNNILTAQSLSVAGGATLSFKLNSTINFIGNNSADPSGGTLINDLGVFDYTGPGSITLNFNYTGQGGDVGHPNVYSLVQFLATGSNVNTSDFTITGLLGDLPDNGSFLTIVPLTGSPGVDVLQLNAVPEPSTWAMLLGGLALLVVFQRRQRQRCRA